MKILVTTFTYPPNKDGVAEAGRLMAEGLANLGWEVWVATASTPGAADVEQRNGVSVRRFNLGESRSDREISRYQEFVINGKFDVIVNHCWEVWSTELLQPVLANLEIPKVMISHGFARQTYVWVPGRAMGLGIWLNGLWWTIWNLPSLIHRYDCIVFLSRKKDFTRFFDHKVASWMGHRRMEFIPNGSESGYFTQDQNSFRNDHGIGSGPMALCVANYCDRKNQKLAVEVFQKAAVPGSTLVFIGSELNSYSEKALALNTLLSGSKPIAQVIFLEKLPREEIFKAFKAADVFLLTAKAETQPIVLIESMAAALPWISTNTGCVELMEGGVVCDNVNSMIAALRELMTDARRRKKLGTEGREAFLSHYTADQCVSRHNSLFLELGRSGKSI